MEEAAKAWISHRHGDEAVDALQQFVDALCRESKRQNLVAPSTIDAIWHRHVLDSAQLLLMAAGWNDWVDIGTGAGFPGMVVAILSNQRMTLVEPRARRADFLSIVVEQLHLEHRVDIVRVKADQLPAHGYDIISARAVASIDAILRMTLHLRHANTRILLPRGRSGAVEVAAARERWQGMFHVEQSLTDPESVILVADGVSR